MHLLDGADSLAFLGAQAVQMATVFAVCESFLATVTAQLQPLVRSAFIFHLSVAS